MGLHIKSSKYTQTADFDAEPFPTRIGHDELGTYIDFPSRYRLNIKPEFLETGYDVAFHITINITQKKGR